ncbi:hypothetical protein LWI29_000483 [Acer saccharum]|uniref:MADS-box domain-containing protein n=1 Tax=Acer saccharum TaxID=4024 RepID=A0AA39VCM0_ACESA|nr:hypothetical protein LWI29_000483 [Acer saccharum]
MNRKVKLCYIVNDSARKATFKKRKKGLLKKMSELSPKDRVSIQEDARDGAKQEQANQDSFLIQRIMKSNYQLKKQREGDN